MNSSSFQMQIAVLAAFVMAFNLGVCAPLNASSKADVQREGLMGIIGDDADQVAQAIRMGLNVWECPRMLVIPNPAQSDPGNSKWFNKRIRASDGYNLSYWASAFGSTVSETFESSDIDFRTTQNLRSGKRPCWLNSRLVHLTRIYDIVGFVDSVGRYGDPATRSNHLLRKNWSGRSMDRGSSQVSTQSNLAICRSRHEGPVWKSLPATANGRRPQN